MNIANQRWYGDLGPRGAVYFETLSSATGSVDKAKWDAMRVGMACTTTDTLAELKREIEQLCSVTTCNYEKVKQTLARFQTHLDDLNGVAK